jgi:hypothetical protein
MYVKLTITWKILYEISINFSTSTLYQLASHRSKANSTKMALEIQQNRKNAKQHLKSRPNADIHISENDAFGIYIFADLEEMNKDCDQSQKSQNLHSASRSIFKEIQNIPSKIIKEATTSNFRTSQVIQTKKKENPLGIHKVNNPDVTNKRHTDTTKQKNKNSERNGKVKNTAKEVVIHSTTICTANKCQDDKIMKNSERWEKQKDNETSDLNIVRKHVNKQCHMKNKMSTDATDLSSFTTEENICYSCEEVDYGESTPPSATHSNDDSAIQKSNTKLDIYSGHSTDYSDYVPSSSLSSSFYCIQKSIRQMNKGSDVLPQHSPLHYLSLDTYLVSISNC